MPRTVLELDLVGYSTIALALEEGLGVEANLELGRQIQGFVDRGLEAVGAPRADTVMQTTGDGAILVFADPRVAHDCAAAVHEAAEAHNRGRTETVGLRVFRMGMATGEIAMQARDEGGFDFGGIVIARAVRLEAKALPGGLLVDAESYAGLDRPRQLGYGTKETIAGKRDEAFAAHRIQFYRDLPAALAELQGVPARPVSARSMPATDAALRKGIVREFRRLKDFQYDTLIFLLNIPFGQRPPRTLSLEERKHYILTWAEQESALEHLWEELAELTGAEVRA